MKHLAVIAFLAVVVLPAWASNPGEPLNCSLSEERWEIRSPRAGDHAAHAFVIESVA